VLHAELHHGFQVAMPLGHGLVGQPKHQIGARGEALFDAKSQGFSGLIRGMNPSQGREGFVV